VGLWIWALSISHWRIATSKLICDHLLVKKGIIVHQELKFARSVWVFASADILSCCHVRLRILKRLSWIHTGLVFCVIIFSQCFAGRSALTTQLILISWCDVSGRDPFWSAAKKSFLGRTFGVVCLILLLCVLETYFVWNAIFEGLTSCIESCAIWFSWGDEKIKL